MLRKPKSPETIATQYGWVNPKTGELLVSIRGLPDPVDGYVLGRPYTAQKDSITEIASDVKPQSESPDEVKDVDPPKESVEVEQKPRVTRKRKTS